MIAPAAAVGRGRRRPLRRSRRIRMLWEETAARANFLNPHSPEVGMRALQVNCKGSLLGYDEGGDGGGGHRDD